MRALDALLPSNAGERRTLADIIFSKLDNADDPHEQVSQKRTFGLISAIPDPLIYVAYRRAQRS